MTEQITDQKIKDYEEYIKEILSKLKVFTGDLMITPTSLVLAPDNDVHAIVAVNKSFRTSLTLEQLLVNEELALEVAAKSMALDLLLYAKNKDCILIPYIPVMLFKAVDPDLYIPYLGIRSRFAEAPIGSRLISASEEREITQQKELEFKKKNDSREF